VHVIRGADGYPVFDGDLAVLNTSQPKERVGGGTVARHDTTRAECSAFFLEKAGFAPRGILNPPGEYPVLYGFHQGLLQKLASLTKPDVQWWLLYLLTIAYLVVIGPVHYRWSRKVDYRIAIGGFSGLWRYSRWRSFSQAVAEREKSRRYIRWRSRSPSARSAGM
jgi:hypothetical protein